MYPKLHVKSVNWNIVYFFAACGGMFTFVNSYTHLVSAPLPDGFDCLVTLRYQGQGQLQCRLVRYIHNGTCPDSQLDITVHGAPQPPICTSVTSPRPFFLIHPNTDIGLHLKSGVSSSTAKPLHFECGAICKENERFKPF